MSNASWALLFGVIGTVLFHLGKGMQKRGIGFIRAMGVRISTGSAPRSMTRADPRRGWIYVTGIMLNNSLVVWIILANRYAPPSYFASVFGLGIIALVLYARFFLEETITPINYAGMMLLVSGTVVLGMESMRRGILTMADVNITALLIFIAVYLIVSMLCILMVFRTTRSYPLGIAFGLFTGGAASLDPVLKGVAQHYGGIPGFVPSTTEGWILFILSFLFATVSFLATQWGFVKNSPASIQVPVGSSVYVCFPILIQGIALPGFAITWHTVAGMLLVIGGILCLTGPFGVPIRAGRVKVSQR